MRPPFDKPVGPTGDRQKPPGGNVTRPRAADDFATIHARLDELRRERERASKPDARGDDDPTEDPGALDRRQRPDSNGPGKNGWLTVSAGRRYGPGRTRS